MNNGINRIQDPELVPKEAIMLNVGERADKKSLLTALSDVCGFPEHFGFNWDAAWDCLQDYAVPHLLLDLRSCSYQANDLKEFYSVIADAYDCWQRPELWVIERGGRAGGGNNRRHFRRNKSNAGKNEGGKNDGGKNDGAQPKQIS